MKSTAILFVMVVLLPTLPTFALESDNFTYTVSGVNTITITGYAGSGGQVVIPPMLDGKPVVVIGAGAFLNRHRLTGVTIPAGVTSIGQFAFYGCRGMQHAFFYGFAPVMGPSVFSNCASVFTVYAPSGNTGFTFPKWQGYRAVSCSDADHDGYYNEGGACGVADCNDNNSEVKPGAEEICNGIDDDCNGVIDNGLAFASYYPDRDNDGYGNAESASAMLACAQPEGFVDNSTAFDCKDNDSSVHPGAPDNDCNGIDDNCDNQTDEGFAGVATSCGIGACASTGRTSCPAGAVEPIDSCAPGTPAASDTTCNGIDENCDGTADEGYAGMQTRCGVGACAATGFALCVNGVVQNTCTPGRPASDANCNGSDDDCDGTPDDDFESMPTSCGVGACAGSSGSTSCVAGAVADSCDPFVGARPDTNCNGIDEDCNGMADDAYMPESRHCGIGACDATGQTFCAGGVVQESCIPGIPTSDANCNGIDDDCDGAIDDDYRPASTTCGVGACAAAGMSSCRAGALQDNCTADSPAQELCNGIDDDCDGSIDNGLEFKTYYRDADADTYGNVYKSVVACDGAPQGYVDNLTDDTTQVAFDCDDSDATLYDGCPAPPCTLQVVPRRIFKMLAIFDPLIPFVISADQESGTAFTAPFAIDWGTSAINDVIRSKISSRSIIGFLLVRPFQLETGLFDVTVAFGVDGVCTGSITVQ